MADFDEPPSGATDDAIKYPPPTVASDAIEALTLSQLEHALDAHRRKLKIYESRSNRDLPTLISQPARLHGSAMSRSLRTSILAMPSSCVPCPRRNWTGACGKSACGGADVSP